MDTAILEQIGLTKSEIKVYFALLELGNSSVGPILAKSKVPTSKVYIILNRLISKGLVTFTEKRNIKYYNAESPNRLLDYIESKKEELSKEKQELQKLLPLMLQKQKKVSGNTAKIFEGRRGIISAYDDIIDTLKSGEEMIYFSLGQENLNEKWVQNFFKEFAEKRREKNILSRGVYPTKLKKIIQNAFKKHPLHKVKYFDYVLPTGVVIYNSKVLLLDWNNLIVFMICSYEVSNSYRKMFEDFWKKAGS